MKNKRRNGFTLVEVLAVISIIGVVAILVLPTLLGVFFDARREVDKFSKETLIDAGKMYVTDLDLGTVEYVAPTTIEVNDRTYNEGDVLSTYDLRVYLIENGIQVNIAELVRLGYYVDDGCNYDTAPDKCSVPESCTLKVGIDGTKVENDKYYVSTAYTSEIFSGCE